MTPEATRKCILWKEIRARRNALLPKIDVWRMDLRTYRRDVHEWRMQSREQRKQGLVPTPPPPLPACPSHIPTDQDLIQIIRRTRGMSVKTSSPENAASDPLAEALAVGDRRPAGGHNEVSFGPVPVNGIVAERGVELCAEVSQVLVPPVWVSGPDVRHMTVRTN